MDLANELIRETYRKHTDLELVSLRNPAIIRKAVAEAKRFILDESMSGFVAELATVPFKVDYKRRPDVLASLRHSAVPPFAKMFIQIDNAAFRKTLLQVAESQQDVYGQQLISHNDDDIVKDIAWLVELQGDEVTVTEFFIGPNGGVVSLPFSYIYSLSDRGFKDGPYRGGWLDIRASAFSHGITGLYDDRMAVLYSKPLNTFPKTQLVEVQQESSTGHTIGSWKVHALVPEFGGVLRYVLSFLATLNNVPKVETQVRPQKGYLGGGQIRKYLDYTTLTLRLPQRTTTVNLAKRLIAASRLGWHEVRPHWRIQKDGACQFHIWSERDQSGHSTCKHCDAKRVWIVLPHGRGDPMISVRTHKYLVTHPKENDNEAR